MFFFLNQRVNAITAYIQINTDTHIISDYSESGFVFAPFDSENDSYYIPFESSTVIQLEQQDFEVFDQSSDPQSVKSKNDHLKSSVQSDR